MIEKRAHQRTRIDAPLTYVLRGRHDQSFQGIGRDISVGGIYIEADQPAAFNSEIIIHVRLPGNSKTFALPGIVRWVRPNGMGVQFGNLGAVETHTITELSRNKAK